MPAPTRTFRGDAVAIAQVTKITAPSVTSAVAFTINGKTLSFSSWVIATIVNTWNGATTVIDPVSQTEEFSAITASAHASSRAGTTASPRPRAASTTSQVRRASS